MQPLPEERMKLLEEAESIGYAVSRETGAISTTSDWRPIQRKVKVDTKCFLHHTRQINVMLQVQLLV